MKYYLLTLHLILSLTSQAQTKLDTFFIQNDLRVVKLSEHSYIHISDFELKEWGRFPSNGFIFVNDGEAVLSDSPMNPELMKHLVRWITGHLKAEVIAFVPNHWHDDCVAGLPYLDSLGIKSYANRKTIEILRSKNLIAPKIPFDDSLELSLGEKKIVFRYFGAGHAEDNIVAWVPSEKILFAGCMVKDLTSTGLGNTSDANLNEWPTTLSKILQTYSSARYVIPGHGAVGDAELVRHTIQLIK